MNNSKVIKLNFIHKAMPNKTFQEIPFSREDTILSLKMRLSKIFDADPNCLSLYKSDESDELADDDSLKQAGLASLDTLYVKDTNPSSILNMIDFEDVSKVKKFVISEDEYAKRKDNMRFFKSKMQEDQRNADYFTKKFYLCEEQDEPEIELGTRCLLGDGLRKGKVAFVGRVPELGKGFWVGVNLDRAEGDTDGE